MRFASISAWLFALSLLFAGAGSSDAQPPTNSFEDVQKLFTKIATSSPDPCEGPVTVNDDVLQAGSSVFEQTAKMVSKSLNDAGTPSALNNATRTLKRVESLSNEANATWPQENRFHSEILEISPLVIVKMTFGVQARFFAFGIPEGTMAGGKENWLWQWVGSDNVSIEHGTLRSWLDLYPLHRGPSGEARFLAAIGYTGCAGSSGLAYEMYEWDPSGVGLQQVINQAGSVGMDEAFEGHKPTTKEPYAPIGVLHTKGPRITLPYCWFSAVDYWDNPSLCTVDTYDLSGDAIRFQSREYNSPELVVIAKALEYADKRDYQALLGYCASSGVARRMVRSVPALAFAEDPRVIAMGMGTERVEFGRPPSAVFDLAKRGNQWVIVSYKAE